MPSVIILSVISLSAIILSVSMLSVSMLSVIMLIVVSPFQWILRLSASFILAFPKGCGHAR